MNEAKQTKAVAKRPAHETVPAATGRSVLNSMAARYSTDANKLLDTLKNTAFKGATNEQLMALCIVADQYRLNPFTKEIYAFPDKTGGIVPVVSIDGWLRIINDHPEFDGMEVDSDSDSCSVTIHRKDRSHPTTVTEFASECKRNTTTWNSHPIRMLRHKAIIQCARVAFGFALKDPDEAERIIEAQAVETRSPVSMPRVIEVKPEQEPPATETHAEAGPADSGDDLPFTA